MAGKITFVVLRLILGAVFLAAGFLKIWDFHQHKWATPSFYEDITNYHINETAPLKFVMTHFPALTEARLSDATKLLAVYLPWLEVVIGAALIVRRATAGAAVLSAVLMGVFILVLASAWQRDLDISCGCFGHENATDNFPVLMVRDLALLLTAVAITWRERLDQTAAAGAKP